MNFSNDGLSLWYGTPDAPAPDEGGVVPRRGAALVVGVQPASPLNTLTVRYRVDDGREQSVAGSEHHVDHASQRQYFVVRFPDFFTGDSVEYLPVLGCGGRQVPAAHVAGSYPSKFRLEPHRAPAVSPAVSRRPQRPATLHYMAGLDFVASVQVEFAEVQYLDETAGGKRVNFFVVQGSVEGDGVRATVMPSSSDHLLVRRDGIGVVCIRAAFATSDGARLDVEAGGYVDFGPEGYRRAQAHDLPDRAPIVVTPLISTTHPRYTWLSRVQCVGVGYTNLHARRASYHVYATSSHEQV